jgi:hypothetical protein
MVLVHFRRVIPNEGCTPAHRRLGRGRCPVLFLEADTMCPDRNALRRGFAGPHRGSFSKTRSRTLAGPLGCPRSCSQFWSVPLLTPVLRAQLPSTAQAWTRNPSTWPWRLLSISNPALCLGIAVRLTCVHLKSRWRSTCRESPPESILRNAYSACDGQNHPRPPRERTPGRIARQRCPAVWPYF